MKNSIRKLKADLVSLETELSNAGAPILERANAVKAALQAEYVKAFKRNRALTKALRDLETTKQLTSIPHDEFYARWIRIDLDAVLADANDVDERAALEAYLDDQHCVRIDFEHSCLTASEGPALIIDDDGDVYCQDASKTVVRASEYADTSERNALIEAWMHKSGYFPSVIKVDRYGEPIGYVNTNTKGMKQ